MFRIDLAAIQSGNRMAGAHNIFGFENCVDGLFEAIYPLREPSDPEHPSGRANRVVLESGLSAFVPGGGETRRLQQQREYVKVDFQDFIDYATSGLGSQPGLNHFPDQTAVFYESLIPVTSPTPDAVWGDRWKFSVTDAAIARDRVFVSVTMRFAVWLKREDGQTIYPEEFGVTLTFAPEKYSFKTKVAGPLAEWERCSWWPPINTDDEWRLCNSGQYTSRLIEQIEEDLEAANCTPELLAKMREADEENHGQWGAFFEVARLGLMLSSYVDFMYDLVVTDRKLVGVKTKQTTGKPRRGKQISFDRPIYKIVRSVRIIRPDEGASEAPQFRQWTAPSYSFLVEGHWRHFQVVSRKGRDADGNEVFGKTWVRSYQKYEDKTGQFLGDAPKKDPRVVINVKQTLQFARDFIGAHQSLAGHKSESPSVEWMADERAKLSAGLRYIILKRDEFRCRKCGRSQADDNFVRLEVDHIIPVSRWGRTVEDNLETLCRHCNSGKSNKD